MNTRTERAPESSELDRYRASEALRIAIWRVVAHHTPAEIADMLAAHPSAVFNDALAIIVGTVQP